jgi:hypothetical protein
VSFQNGIKFQSFVEFWEYLPEEERIITDTLREIILKTLPANTKEKLTYNVPFYYGKRRICLIWPASVPWGGFKCGVMLGFLYGYKLKDKEAYLTHGTNKQVFYKIYHSTNEIHTKAIVRLLKEAIDLDATFK